MIAKLTLPLVIGAALSSCVIVVDEHGRMRNWNRGHRGSGVRAEETRQVHDFHSVEFELAGSVVVTVGPATSITLSGDDDLLSHVRTQVDRGVLEIDMDGNYDFEAELRVEITTPDLASFEIDGAGDVEIHGLERDHFTASIDGAGDFSAHGSVRLLEASIDGAGDMSLQGLAARDARVSIDGAGSIHVSVADNLEYSIDGAGDIRYSGRPEVSGSIDGAGSVSRN